jgi:hypothetical protein
LVVSTLFAVADRADDVGLGVGRIWLLHVVVGVRLCAPEVF